MVNECGFVFPELSDIHIKYCFRLQDIFTIQKQMIGKIAMSP